MSLDCVLFTREMIINKILSIKYSTLMLSGQLNIISVRFWPNILAEISFSFGISAFVSFGIRQKHTFRPKEAVLAKIDLIGPSIFD